MAETAANPNHSLGQRREDRDNKEAHDALLRETENQVSNAMAISVNVGRHILQTQINAHTTMLNMMQAQLKQFDVWAKATDQHQR